MQERARYHGQTGELRASSPNNIPGIRSGIEGFADAMSIFPRLKEWENQIALQALREGKTVQDLRGITPFRQYLTGAQQAGAAGRDDPFLLFANLFDASPGIDMLVSFGNFHTIRTWTWTLAKQHSDLNFPLEHFYQDALYHIVPAQAKSYDPFYGRTFTSYVVSMLKKRFRNFVQEHKRDYTTPVSYEEKQASKYGRPAASKTRVSLASVDVPMSDDPTQTFLAYYADQTALEEETTAERDQQTRARIHLLATLAGLPDREEETLLAIFLYGGDTRLLSQLRRCTSRTVRLHRQHALEKIARLGFETVRGVLTGSIETVEEAKESLLQVAEQTHRDEMTRGSEQ